MPVISDEDERFIYFVRYVYGDALHLNQYSILEPVKKNQRIKSETLDMVITPFVAFDLHGHRLGTGGGYYDKTFSFLHDQAWTKPLMIGLGYAAQLAHELPTDPWDIKLNGVVTEKKFISF